MKGTIKKISVRCPHFGQVNQSEKTDGTENHLGVSEKRVCYQFWPSDNVGNYKPMGYNYYFSDTYMKQMMET